MKLGILGTGNMAEALIAGLTAKKVLRPQQITGYDISTPHLRSLTRKYKIGARKSAREVTQTSDTILLAVKPQQIKGLLSTIRPFLTKKHLILSIAAGIDTTLLEKFLGKKIKIVRIMPNTPALIGLGAAAFYLNKNCSGKDRAQTQKIFRAAGCVLEVKKESLLDGVTGLSGSGPAFVYEFIEAMIAGGQKMGLKKDMARKLALQTVIGAAQMIRHTGSDPKELTARVASKGGTTLAGLKVLKRTKFGSSVQQCIRAATRRARELRKLT